MKTSQINGERPSSLIFPPSSFHPLLAAIAKKGKGVIEQIKGRNDIELFEVTRENREQLVEEIVKKIKEGLGAI